jgi:HK97 family phage major capsid protein/HK97 family phage prohead protease
MTDQYLTRELTLDFRAADDDSVPATISSEYPVPRNGYSEILSHAPGAIDLSRSPLPLIESHDSGKVNIGLVENLRVENGRLRGSVRFGKSTRGRELLADIRAGIVRNLSVGYQILAESWDQTRTVLTATKWALHEASVVAVGADPTAQFFRGSNMTTENVSGERERVREILAIGRLHNQAERAERAVAEGASLEQFRSDLLAHLAKGQRAINFTTDNLTAFEQNRYSILRVARALADPQKYAKDAGFEAEVSRSLAQQSGRESRGYMIPLELMAKRDLTTSIGTGTSKAGYTVATDLHANEFVDVLRNASVCAQAGARMLPGLVGNVTIPRRTAGVTASWVSEGNAASEGTSTFDQLTMSPKTCTGWIDITRRLMLQSTPAVEQLVRDDLIGTILAAVDSAALGGATTNGPTGIRGTSGIGSVAIGTNGGAPTWASIVNLVKEVAIDNALAGQLAYVTNEKVRCKLAQTPKQASGVEGNFILSDPNTLFGYRFLTTNAIPSNLTKGSANGVCSAMLFGNWNDLLIGLWSGVDLIVDNLTQATSGTVRLVAFQDVDVCVKQAPSFSAILDLTTT